MRISVNLLEAICKVIADSNNGLTGFEIGKLLADSRIPDIDPTMTKWKRLYNAFVSWQNKNNCSNNIWDFLQKAMSPVRYLDNKEVFESRRSKLNMSLSFVGVKISESGKLIKTATVDTITEAEEKADKLKGLLKSRDVHLDVIKFCKAELLQENYFHAVFEATKSVADKIRELSGLSSDGVELIENSFGINDPVLIINKLITETEKSEHKGFANLLKGFFGMFRNTLAHEPKIKWIINENDALDIMTLASFFHRKLDSAQRIK